jgi:hypothetical protein
MIESWSRLPAAIRDHLVEGRGARDPSLRLKNGFVRDDADEVTTL